MELVEEGLNDEFLWKMLTDSLNRMKIPMKGMGVREYLSATKAFMETDPYLTMFVLYLGLGPCNPLAGGLMCEADSILVQDPLHVYKPFKELGRHTGILRKASYQGLTVFMQKVSKASAYKHMYVKDMYDAILDHFRNKPQTKSDPIEDFLNMNIEDDWYTSKSGKVMQEVQLKLGSGRWTNFFDVYLHYSLMYSGDVIRSEGNTATKRRYREKLDNMGKTLNARNKVSGNLQDVKQFLQSCEGCTEIINDPLVDKIMERSGLANANVINTFRKYLHETTQDFMMFDDMGKNLQAWELNVKTAVNGDDPTFAQDLSYRVWITRYWDCIGYQYF